MSGRVARPDFGTLGSSGLATIRGVLYDQYQSNLSGKEGRKALAEMREQDPVVNGILFAIEMLIKQVEWSMNPADDSPEAADIAEFVESCLYDMSVGWQDTLSEILSFLVYGWSYMETIYKLRGGDTDDGATRSAFNDGRIGWRKWSLRPQDTLGGWMTDGDGIQGMIQTAPPDYKPVEIPIEKALLFRTTPSQANPEGRSLLRGAYRPWYFKRNIENIEAIGIERELSGLPVMYLPAEYFSEDATPDQKKMVQMLTALVTSIRNDESAGLLIPRQLDENGNDLFSFSLVTSGGTRAIDTDKAISRYDQRIAMSVLADFILLGHEAVGSKALSVDKTRLFTTALDAFTDHIAGVVNDHAIPRLLRYNGMDVSLRPQLSAGDLNDVDLSELAAFVKTLSDAGAAIFPDATLEDHLLGLAKLPTPVRTDDAPVVDLHGREAGAADDALPDPDAVLDLASALDDVTT